MPRLLGDELFARDAEGRLRSRIATVFPKTQTIVTLPGIHASQRLAYVDDLNQQRHAQGLPPLSEEEEEAVWDNSVDLIIENDIILIRPDPINMDLAFEADELLQEIASKKKIKFLHVLDPQVRDAIRRHGERWRISPLPRSPMEMQRMIESSRIGISGREIYYYNKSTGSRILTFQEFRGLAKLSDEELRRHMAEVRDNCACCNRLGSVEVQLFMADPNRALEIFSSDDLCSPDPAKLRAAYEEAVIKFRDAVPLEFHRDVLLSPEWRSRMFAALIGHTDQVVSEERMLGLSAEFFMQVEWLPGGRIEEGELLLDPVFDEEASTHCPDKDRISDEKARGFIFNFIRDYGDLEYINIGRVVGSLSTRDPTPGRRAVYLAEIKQRGTERTILRIIRMQKWGVHEHLDEGKDLLASVLESDEYTEYILNRRLGCRQLGMNLSPRVTSRKVGERYLSRNGRYYGTWIWSTYFERDYIGGTATDKIASPKFENADYALRFARLMGRAAAPNLIVGRCDISGHIIFDDGDELVLEDTEGLPVAIVVADHTGTFGDYRRELRELAPVYAGPINERISWVPNPTEFSEAYLAAFIERFNQIQTEYIKRRRAFDTLFKHLNRDEGGSFSFRWERVLERLEISNPTMLADRMRQSFKKP